MRTVVYKTTKGTTTSFMQAMKDGLLKTYLEPIVEKKNIDVEMRAKRFAVIRNKGV